MRLNFWDRVQIGGDDECWPWQGGKDKDGYGIASVAGSNTRRAHRIAWELHNRRRIPKGKHVLHSCDVRDCCNHRHLHLGSHQDNMRDRTRKGRCASKLTLHDVIDIRGRAWATGTFLAMVYGVSTALISAIRNGKAWSRSC